MIASVAFTVWAVLSVTRSYTGKGHSVSEGGDSVQSVYMEGLYMYWTPLAHSPKNTFW